MAGRRRRLTAGGLAGWLFADLALVLAFVFLDSSTPGQAGNGPRPSAGNNVAMTSTTSLDDTKGNGGARPKPYQIVIGLNNSASAASVIAKVEAALARSKAAAEGEDVVYLVVIAHGGSKGASRSTGSDLARRVADKLESNWRHVVKGTTYFETGDNGNLPPGSIMLKLFPAQRQGD